MSLSARIAVRASRRLEVVAGGLAIGGVVVAAFSAACRWPGSASMLAGAATAIAIAIGFRRVRCALAAADHVLSVSDRVEIAVSTDPESGDGESWRLDDSTMMWPGFSVIGLRKGCDAVPGGRSMRLAVFDAELCVIDRRSLHRFLLWSLRGGQGQGAATRARPVNTSS